VGPNALWPTQPKFWVGHGPIGPRCSAPHGCHNTIMEKINGFGGQNSGWIVSQINYLRLCWGHYRPLMAGKFIPTPKFIASKNAIVNIQCYDDCFHHLILSGMNIINTSVNKRRPSLYNMNGIPNFIKQMFAHPRLPAPLQPYSDQNIAATKYHSCDGVTEYNTGNRWQGSTSCLRSDSLRSCFTRNTWHLGTMVQNVTKFCFICQCPRIDDCCCKGMYITV